MNETFIKAAVWIVAIATVTAVAFDVLLPHRLRTRQISANPERWRVERRSFFFWWENASALHETFPTQWQAVQRLEAMEIVRG